MKFTYLTQLVTLSFLLFVSSALNGQVTIGTSEPPMSGALLDLKNKNGDKGMGMPRVALKKAKKLYPMFWDNNTNAEDPNYTANETALNLEHTGLLVYNITKSSPQNLYPGMYVWDGTQWVPLFETPEPDMGPNSYFVKPNTTGFEIPVYKAYGIWEKFGSRFGTVDFENATTFEAKILWEEGDLISNHDNSSDFLLPIEGEGSEGVIKINTTANEGNAMVAFFVDGVVRWSWHIWVTNYDPDNGGTTYPYNNGHRDYVWMDRNLGATSATPSNAGTIGLYYLFGRKDPSPRVADFAGSKPTNLIGAMLPDYGQNGLNDFSQPFDVTYANSIKNPWAYMGGGGVTGTWYEFNTTTFPLDKDFYHDIWGQESNKKTLFDPCPEGWAVPRVYPAAYDVHNNLDYGNWPFLYNGSVTGDAIDYGYLWDKGAYFNGKPDFQMGYFPATGSLNSWWAFGEPNLDNIGSNCMLLTAMRGQSGHMGNVVTISIWQNSISPMPMQSGTAMNVRCVKE